MPNLKKATSWLPGVSLMKTTTGGPEPIVQAILVAGSYSTGQCMKGDPLIFVNVAATQSTLITVASQIAGLTSPGAPPLYVAVAPSGAVAAAGVFGAGTPQGLLGVAMNSAALNGVVTVALAVPENIFIIRGQNTYALNSTTNNSIIPHSTCDLYFQARQDGAASPFLGTLPCIYQGGAFTKNTLSVEGWVPGDDITDSTTPGRCYIRIVKAEIGVPVQTIP